MAATNVFLNMSVDQSNKMCKLFNCLIESTIRSFIQTVTFRIVYYKTVKMTPVVIQIFNKTCKLICIIEEDFGLIKNMGYNTGFILNQQRKCFNKMVNTLFISIATPEKFK